jgi:lipopolysaccharide export system protein LptC
LTTTHIHDRGPRAYLTAGRNGSDSDRAFRAARRHSRWVRVLRLGLPLSVVLGCVATYVVVKVFDPFGALSRMPLGADGVVISGTKIIMQQPRMKGFSRDKRPYTLTARTAAQDVTAPDLMELNEVRALLMSTAHGEVEITARDGFYDSKAEKLKLEHNVIVSSSEFEVHLSEAMIQIKSGHIVSERPVVVNMMQGVINSNRLEVVESGAVLRFEGGVSMVVNNTGEKNFEAKAATGSVPNAAAGTATAGVR